MPIPYSPLPREESPLTQAVHSSVAEASVTASSAQSGLGFRLSLSEPSPHFRSWLHKGLNWPLTSVTGSVRGHA